MDKLSGWIKKVTNNPSENTGSVSQEQTGNKSTSSNDSRSQTSSSTRNAGRSKSQTSSSDQKTSHSTRSGSQGRNHQNRRNNNSSSNRGKSNQNRRGHANNQNRQNNRTTEQKPGSPKPRPRFIPNKTPTIPSQPVKRTSVAKKPSDRRQRPRPMLGKVSKLPSQNKYPQHEKFPKGTPMRVIPFGGLNEVGKNSMAVEYDGEIIIIDIGLQFPEENMPGVDYVIPDLSYAVENKEKIKAIVITHGHLDHIGALHHYMEKLGYPKIYAPRLAKALIEKRFAEHELNDKVQIIEVKPEENEGKFALGKFTLQYFRVNHSIPDSCGIFIKTDAGTMVHTGDFKFDFTPNDGCHADMHKMVEFSKQGVDMIFADSTNALRDGFCPSEKIVSDNIGQVIREATGRLIIATFASSIGRHQAIIDHAVANGRKVFVSGRSMNENIAIAHDLGIINVPKSSIKPLSREVDNYPPHEVLVLTTGSQGEPFAALSRIARDEHHHIKLDFDDTIAFSSSPIPGNERALYAIVDMLHRKGCKVVTKLDIDIHASGHGFQGDLKLMHSLIKPKYVIPIHGEYFMRVGHRKMVIDELGYDERHSIMIENGSVLELLGGVARKSKEKIDCDLVFVDGKDHADISERILMERAAMSEGGIVSVLIELDKESKKLKRNPRILTEGFLENANVLGVILDQTKIAYTHLYNTQQEKITEKAIVEKVTNHLHLELLKEVDREPVIQVIVTLI